MTRIYLKQNVYEAALDRIRFLYDEFPVVAVSISGGKDSTVVLNLTLQVAKERGRLPLEVFWLDQEAEWQATVDMIRKVKAMPDVKFHWFQVPFITNNSPSGDVEFLHCWEPGKKWIRPQEPDSIKHYRDGDVERFKMQFPAIMKHLWPNQKAAAISGMRAEESPTRMIATTTQDRYKGKTWGARNNTDPLHMTFHPIYDWRWQDVWKSIHDGGWAYARLYDAQYKKGLPVREMRLSSLTHETAMQNLAHLQEIEPDTWNRIVERLPGVHGCGNWAKKWFPSELPEAFKTWREYRDHLLETIVPIHRRPTWVRKFELMDRHYKGFIGFDGDGCKMQCIAMAANDFEFVKLGNWERNARPTGFRRWKAYVEDGSPESLAKIHKEEWIVNNPAIPRPLIPGEA